MEFERVAQARKLHPPGYLIDVGLQLHVMCQLARLHMDGKLFGKHSSVSVIVWVEIIKCKGDFEAGGVDQLEIHFACVLTDRSELPWFKEKETKQLE